MQWELDLQAGPPQPVVCVLATPLLLWVTVIYNSECMSTQHNYTPTELEVLAT